METNYEISYATEWEFTIDDMDGYYHNIITNEYITVEAFEMKYLVV